MMKKGVTSQGLKTSRIRKHHQRHLWRRRRIPLQACAEANPTRNTLFGAGHDKPSEIHRGPNLLFQE
jgi:hypothetical protein